MDQRVPGSTDQSVYVHMADSSDGTDKTDLTFSDFTVEYARGERAARTGITEATLASETAAHSDGGIIHVALGIYRIDLPDAAFASGVDRVYVYASASGAVQTGGAHVVTLSLNVTQIEGADATDTLAGFIGGTGARTIAITVDDGSNPIDGAIVRLTKGAESYTGTTDASGDVTFNVDDGTWTVAITEPGYSFAGTTLVVDGDETATYSMTAISITPAADPAQTTGYLTTRNGQGTVEGSVLITFTLIEKNTAGQSYESDTFTATSHASTGLLEVTLLRAATYKARRGDIGPAVQFTTGSDATYQLPQVLGGTAANQLE